MPKPQRRASSSTPASGVDETTVAQVQADLRRRILRAFVGRGLIDSVDAKEMLAYQHSSFSVNASVYIEAHDRAALERLLRYCARPLPWRMLSFFTRIQGCIRDAILGLRRLK